MSAAPIDRPAPQASEAAPPDGGDTPTPWDRAHDFVDYLARLSEDEWEEVLQRVHAIDAPAHAAALHRVADLLDAHPDVPAVDALQRAACAAPPARMHAGRLATHAAFALALRDALSAHEFAALYGPFARPEPSPVGAGPTALDHEGYDHEHRGEDRRVAVAALAEVARPLSGV